MIDAEKYGTAWADDELDLIVADYFSMLAAELANESYVKSHHSAALMALIGRSHRSVEFKHQNISAVLEELGLPWIRGYVPKNNYQNAIFDAIDRFLTSNQSILEITPKTLPTISAVSLLFVPPPVLSEGQPPLPMRLQRLVRKFDPVERDYRNRVLGKAGEAFIFELERRRLKENDCGHLADKVRWVANEDGDGAGYDILSYEFSGDERLIEVKTTNGAARTPFYLTRNEWEVARERPKDWQIYRLHSFAGTPLVFTLSPPLEGAVTLHPQTWRASF